MTNKWENAISLFKECSHTLNLVLVGGLVTFGSGLSAGAFIYRNHNIYLASCLKSNGRAVAGGKAWDLPLGHPFHTLAALCFFG